MKAIVYTHYGSPDALQLKEVATPTPADDEVLIKVQAVSVNRSDWEDLTGTPLYARIWGLFKPRHQILGSDIAGRVEKAGRNHRQFQPGDEVFIMPVIDRQYLLSAVPEALRYLGEGHVKGKVVITI